MWCLQENESNPFDTHWCCEVGQGEYREKSGVRAGRKRRQIRENIIKRIKNDFSPRLNQMNFSSVQKQQLKQGLLYICNTLWDIHLSLLIHTHTQTQ